MKTTLLYLIVVLLLASIATTVYIVVVDGDGLPLSVATVAVLCVDLFVFDRVLR